MAILDSKNHATTKPCRRFIAAVGAGLFALGMSSGVAAHESGHHAGYEQGGHGSHVVHHQRYSKHRGHGRRHARRHGRHGRRGRHGRHHGHDAPRKVVIVHHYQHEPAPVVYRSQAPHDYQQSSSQLGSHGQINAGSLMGAAIGGLIGSQIGAGRGQLAATAAGTVGGFLLGNHATHGYR